MRVGWLSRGQLHVRDAGGSSREVHSAFLERTRARHQGIADRHAWKEGSLSFGRTGAAPAPEVLPRGIFSSALPGRDDQRVLYALDTGPVGGLFAELSDGTEQRLFHTERFRIRCLAPDGEHGLLVAVAAGSYVHLATMRRDGTRVEEITEGDALDLHPCASADGRRILYQSAGQSRDPSVPWVFGPFEVLELDRATGALTTVYAEAGRDLLQPRYAADGDGILVLRTPPRPVGPGFLERVTTALTWPFRVIAGLLHFVSIFGQLSNLPGGATPTGARADDARLRALLLGQAWQPGPQGAAEPPMPTASAAWELVRVRRGAEPEVVARHVIAWDQAPDGGLLLTDGHTVTLQRPDGRRETLVQGEAIHQVFWLGAA